MSKIVATIYKESYNYIMQHYKEVIEEENIDFRLIDKNDKEATKEIEILLSGTMKRKQFDDYPNLTDVIVPYTGLNGLDVNMLRAAGVRIYNTSAHGKFVAERALSLLLGVQGRILYFHNRLLEGNWCNRLNYEKREVWDSIFNKKIAIYGYGHIGYTFHQLLKPFHVEVGVLNYKEREYEDTKGFYNLRKLTQWCDALVIMAPLNETTNDSINKDIFEYLEGKVIVNVSRGAIVNEDALYHGILSGDLLGFGSDVWYQYPKVNEDIKQPSKYDFSSYENVIMTPHNAGLERTSTKERHVDLVEQLVKIINGDYSTQL